MLYVLNNYYIASLDTYSEGRLIFPINDLPSGRYTAKLKVWDIHNNSSQHSVDFIVSDQPRIRLFNVLNFPNPARDFTRFSFEHDRVGEELAVRIEIFNVRGALVVDNAFVVDGSDRLIDPIDMTLPPGKFAEGMYFYRLSVESDLDGARGQEIGRLLIAK